MADAEHGTEFGVQRCSARKDDEGDEMVEYKRLKREQIPAGYSEQGLTESTSSSSAFATHAEEECHSMNNFIDSSSLNQDYQSPAASQTSGNDNTTTADMVASFTGNDVALQPSSPCSTSHRAPIPNSDAPETTAMLVAGRKPWLANERLSATTTVCFNWTALPGTVKFREIVRLHVKNQLSHPAWNNSIADLVRAELVKEGFTNFLVLVNPQTGVLCDLIGSGELFIATEEDFIAHTKKEFLAQCVEKVPQ